MLLVPLGHLDLGQGEIDLVVIVDVLLILEHLEELLLDPFRIPDALPIG